MRNVDPLRLALGLGVAWLLIALGVGLVNARWTFLDHGPVYYLNKAASGKPRPVASTFADIQPEDVACKGDLTVGQSDTARGLFYRAEYRAVDVRGVAVDYHLTWTAGDVKFAMTDGHAIDWPSVDNHTKARDCLTKRSSS